MVFFLSFLLSSITWHPRVFVAVDIGRELAAVVAAAVAAPLYLGQGYAGVLFTAIAPEGTCLLLLQIFSDFCQPLHRVLLLSDKLMKWISSPG